MVKNPQNQGPVVSGSRAMGDGNFLMTRVMNIEEVVGVKRRWSYKEAVGYLNGFIDFERQPEPRLQTETKDIDRFRLLLQGLGNPHLAYPTVHVAGTKGKGSTSVLLASILQSAGYKVGLYTSPHLKSVRERIVVSGRAISKRDFAKILRRIAFEFESLNCDRTLAFRTVFELLTAAGFLEFQRQKVDIAIIEAGLGAKLDATIVVDPILAVMTPIGLDHTQVLGDTVELIAADKAHIIKSGVTVVSARQVAGASRELQKRADSVGGLVKYAPGAGEFSVTAASLKGTELYSNRSWLADSPLHLALPGSFQLVNLSVVLTAIEELKSKGFSISSGAVESGLASARWPGRMQLIGRKPQVIIDGAHNALAVRAFRDSLHDLIGEKKSHIVFSSIIGKPVEEMAAILAPDAELMHIAPLKFPKGVSLEILKDAVQKAGGEYRTYPDVPAALAGAKQCAGVDGLVVVTGSLYLVSEVLRYYKGLSLSSSTGGIDDSI